MGSTLGDSLRGHPADHSDAHRQMIQNESIQGLVSDFYNTLSSLVNASKSKINKSSIYRVINATQDTQFTYSGSLWTGKGSYSTIAALQADMAIFSSLGAGQGIGQYQVGGAVYTWDGCNLKISSIQPSSSNYPNLRLSKNIANTFNTAQGANALASHTAALEQALEPILPSTLWPKLKILWVPLGNGSTIAGALQCIKYVSSGSIGIGTGLTNTAFIAADYTPSTGLTGNGSGKYLSTGLNPNAANIDGSSMTSGNIGIAVHSNGVSSSGLLATDAGNSMYVHYSDGTSKAGGVQPISNIYPRMMAVQQNASTGNAEIWNAGNITSAQAMTSPNLPGSSGIVGFGILGNPGGGQNSNATATGFALFDALTAQEMDLLSRFFDQLNYLIGRNYDVGLVAAGDSIISGAGLVSSANRFTTLLAVQLGLTEQNLGIAGTTLSNLGVSYWAPSLGSASGNTQSLLVNGAANGGLWIFEPGINDPQKAGFSLAQFANDYASSLAYIKVNGIPPQNVICCTILNVDWTSLQGQGYPTMTQATAIAQNAIIKQTAAQYGFQIADLFSINLQGAGSSGSYQYLDYSVNTPHGIHPNIAGNNLVYQYLLSVINTNFPQRIPANTNFIYGL